MFVQGTICLRLCLFALGKWENVFWFQRLLPGYNRVCCKFNCISGALYLLQLIPTFPLQEVFALVEQFCVCILEITWGRIILFKQIPANLSGSKLKMSCCSSMDEDLGVVHVPQAGEDLHQVWRSHSAEGCHFGLPLVFFWSQCFSSTCLQTFSQFVPLLSQRPGTQTWWLLFWLHAVGLEESCSQEWCTTVHLRNRHDIYRAG